MYKLTKVSLHNWYLVDALDIPISDHTALIGQTGAGKSAILDAIQTVMSGNNRNVLELNAAAGQHKSRSVRDYALGCVTDVNEGKPRRERCESTLALTFHDAQLKKFVTIGLFLRSEAGQAEKARRFVAEGLDFSISDFVKNDQVIPHKEMISEIQERVGSGYQTYPSSRKYVAAYLEYMRPSAPPEPRHFLRSFSNALQAREMSDPTDFVRRFVLEPLTLDMGEVQESIDTWRDLAVEAARAEERLGELARIRGMYEKSFEHRFIHLSLQVESRNDLLSDLDQKISDSSLEKSEKANTLMELRGEAQALREKKSSLMASLEMAGRKDDGALQAKKDAVAAQRDSLSERIQNLTRQLDQGISLFAPLGDLNWDSHPQALQAAGQAARELKGLATNPEMMGVHAHKISAILSHEASIRQDLEESRQQLYSLRANESSGEEVSTTARLASDAQGFRDLLNEQGISSAALPEKVTVKDEDWVLALENILGSNRDAILVADEDLEQAYDLLYKNRHRLPGARLINTRRLERMEIDTSSISEIIDSDDEMILKFVAALAGPVSRVQQFEIDEDQWTTRTGKISADNTLRVFAERDTLLGAAPAPVSSGDAKEDLAALGQRIEDSEKVLMVIHQAATFPPGQLRQLAEDLQKASSEKRSLDARLAGLEATSGASSGKSSLSLISEIENQEQKISDKIRKSEIAIAVLDERIEAAQVRKEELSEGFQDVLKALEDISWNDGFSAMEARCKDNWKALRERLDDYEGAERARRLNELLAEHDDYSDLIARSNTALFRYAEKWIQNHAPLAAEISDEDRFSWVVGEHDKLEGSVIIKYREKLEAAQEEMEASLKEGLLNRLGEQFRLMEMQLEALNRRLSKYHFVGQTYSFRSSLSARLAPIYELVEDMRSADFDSSSIEDHPGFKLISEILNEEETIKQFNDYRNFFNFEMYIEHPDPEDNDRVVSTPFSQIMGKLSGGQRQAPYYVAIGASMVSAYYPQAEEGDYSGMGLILFDEAFNKLDIPNTQRLVDMFDQLGLQVLVAAPEEKRSSLIESVNSIVSVGRQPGSSDVFIDSTTIGPKAKAAMKAENPELQMS